MAIRTRPLKKTQTVKRQNAINGALLKLWEEYAPWYQNTFGKITVFQGFAKQLENYLLPVPEGVVLDGGCGPGLHFERIIRATKASRLIGLDISPSMLKEAGKTIARLNRKYRCQIDLKKVDLCQGIPFSENTFDAQVYHLVLYYLPSGKWQSVLREAFQVAKPGGYVVSTHVLKRFDFREEIGIPWLIKEMLIHPRAVFLTMRKVRPIMTKFQDLEQGGNLSYPSLESLIRAHRELGFQDIAYQFIWKTNTVMIRAHKPS